MQGLLADSSLDTAERGQGRGVEGGNVVWVVAIVRFGLAGRVE